MTEAEALELVAIYTANAHTSFNMYISVTFAYFATAFFVGSIASPARISISLKNNTLFQP